MAKQLNPRWGPCVHYRRPVSRRPKAVRELSWDTNARAAVAPNRRCSMFTETTHE